MRLSPRLLFYRTFEFVPKYNAFGTFVSLDIENTGMVLQLNFSILRSYNSVFMYYNNKYIRLYQA